jgi:glycosyltransferase involved in cell wall biosynthesis
LIRAYARWRRQDPEALPLVVAGGKGWYYGQIFELVESLGLKTWVRFPGYVPQDVLPLWYNAATLFVYPSRFEGFGLPVLEAMACGAPVITSTASSLPEVAGHHDTARMVDPEDIETLAATMAEVARDADLRAMLRQNGLAQAANFRWEKTAQETVALYQKVMEKDP